MSAGCIPSGVNWMLSIGSKSAMTPTPILTWLAPFLSCSRRQRPPDRDVESYSERHAGDAERVLAGPIPPEQACVGDCHTNRPMTLPSKHWLSSDRGATDPALGSRLWCRQDFRLGSHASALAITWGLAPAGPP